MNGDLLRTLEGPETSAGPENCLRPKLIQASREGHCVIYYENGLFCVFSVNGRLQATMETDDKIKVSVLKWVLRTVSSSVRKRYPGWSCMGTLSTARPLKYMVLDHNSNIL